MRRHERSAAGAVLGLALAAVAAAVPASGSEVLWQAAATSTCRIGLSFANGPVEIALGGAAPRLLGDPQQVAVETTAQDGATLLTVTTSATETNRGVGVVLEAPATCQLDVETQTSEITLFAAKDSDLAVRLATSGEVTVDFSVTIDYHRHEEPAKRGSITIGSGTNEVRLSSREGAIRVLRPRR